MFRVISVRPVRELTSLPLRWDVSSEIAWSWLAFKLV